MTLRHLRRRLLHSMFLLLGVSALAFLLCDAAPGNFFDEMRLNPSIAGESVAALRAQHGLDKPLPIRYARWCASVLRGEFGFSFAYNAPAGPLLWTRMKNTLLLTGVATGLAWLVALLLGAGSAARKGAAGDRLATAGTALLLSVPDLLLALGLMYLALRTGWLPTGGMVSVNFDELARFEQMKDLVWHMTLPVTALALGILPMLIRHIRSALAEALESPFLLAARAHGISRGRLLFRHALPVAANPLITLFGLTVGNLLGASLLIEVVMGWPGLGPLFLEAILARDFYLVIGAVLFSTLAFVVGSLTADLVLAATDPRIRFET